MKFRHEPTYDASPADVFEMLADPKFREAASAAQVEKILSEKIAAGLEAEHGVGVAWLAGDH